MTVVLRGECAATQVDIRCAGCSMTGEAETHQLKRTFAVERTETNELLLLDTFRMQHPLYESTLSRAPLAPLRDISMSHGKK